jgi:hypothetical protein
MLRNITNVRLRTLWALFFVSIFVGAQKIAKIERRVENGVEIIVNHLEPYKLAVPQSLKLDEEFIIDLAADELIRAGLAEPTGLDIDSSGDINIWNQGKSENFIYKFDRKGKYLTSFGRRGQGPGELQFPTSFAINDRGVLVISDTLQRKMVILGKDGAYIRQAVADSPLIYPKANDRYVLILRESNPNEDYTSNTWILCDTNLKKLKELDRSKEVKYSLAKSIPALPPLSGCFLSKRNIFVAKYDKDYEIRVFNLDGTLERRILKEYKPVPLTGKRKENLIKRFERLPVDLRKKVIYPDSLLPFQCAFADDEVRLYVMTYEETGKPGEFWYDIFDKDGVFVGRMKLDNYGQYGVTREGPTFAMAKAGRLYYFREKVDGFKDLVICRMSWTSGPANQKK